MCKFYKYYKELKKSKESPLQTAFPFLMKEKWNRPGIVSTPYWTQAKDWRQRKQVHIHFSGSSSPWSSSIKWTQKRTTPFWTAFLCLWGSVCRTHKYAGTDRQKRFHGSFLQSAYCLLHGLWYIMDNFNHFYRISRQISHQTTEEYVFI